MATITTVSRALNGYSDISESTRKLIKEAAESLNYSPNGLTRGLVMKETKTLGLLVSGMTYKNIDNNFVFEVLCGINVALPIRTMISFCSARTLLSSK
ncbi:LacI family DNA-binding transcriptional regulator [Paenibacillus terrae]|uniref:LacI family DNA-binding transcriptional regulator n=1 Tax=Paenibacillus terrae TaxID=159743 RepID=UPI0026A380DE